MSGKIKWLLNSFKDYDLGEKVRLVHSKKVFGDLCFYDCCCNEHLHHI